MFHPWTTLAAYRDLLALLVELDLAENIAPIQLAIRLLIPAHSRLLELPQVQALVGEFDPAALAYPWTHSDARVAQLYEQVSHIVKDGQARKQTRREIFAQVWQCAYADVDSPVNSLSFDGVSKPIPHLSEPWYC